MKTKLKVRLISHTPDPEATISAAARLCYSRVDIDQLLLGATNEDQRQFLEKLIGVGHTSPIEHASFTFGVEGISRACSHQLVRYRIASYSQQSQRYVGKEKGFGYIIPPSIAEDPELERDFEDLMEKIHLSYKQFVQRLAQKGIKGEKAYEDARFVLPNATETKLIVTMNARELLHFFRQRLCNRAQWEIREMAEAMLSLVTSVAPTIFKYAGPPGVLGKCPEGPRTCGRPYKKN